MFVDFVVYLFESDSIMFVCKITINGNISQPVFYFMFVHSKVILDKNDNVSFKLILEDTIISLRGKLSHEGMQRLIFAHPFFFSCGNDEESDDISDDATGSDDEILLTCGNCAH